MNIRLYTLHLVVAPSQVHQFGLNSRGFSSVAAEKSEAPDPQATTRLICEIFTDPMMRI